MVPLRAYQPLYTWETSVWAPSLFRYGGILPSWTLPSRPNISSPSGKTRCWLAVQQMQTRNLPVCPSKSGRDEGAMVAVPPALDPRYTTQSFLVHLLHYLSWWPSTGAQGKYRERASLWAGLLRETSGFSSSIRFTWTVGIPTDFHIQILWESSFQGPWAGKPLCRARAHLFLRELSAAAIPFSAQSTYVDRGQPISCLLPVSIWIFLYFFSCIWCFSSL